jgi:hypothetical protein
MALTLSDVIQGVRGRHPAFSRQLVPDATIARFLTGYQRELTSKALIRNKAFLAQQMSVAFAVNSSNAVGTAGAGTTGGMPVDATESATSIVQAPMGTASELNVNGVVLVSESVVTSATTTTLTKTGAGWTTNAYANKHIVIRSGAGAGQVRSIASNTATVLTLGAGEAFTTVPDTTSTFEVVDGTIEATETFGVVASDPWSVERRGYLVKVTAGGVPYLDLDTPLLARYDVGIPLPPMHHLITIDVRFDDPDDKAPLTLVNWIDKDRQYGAYQATILGNSLYLGGSSSDWTDVTALDVRYVPIPPALTRTSDYFLLPDSAYQTLVDAAAVHAAIRVNGAEGVPVMAFQLFQQQKMESEATFLREVGAQKRVGVIREWSGR